MKIFNFFSKSNDLCHEPQPLATTAVFTSLYSVSTIALATLGSQLFRAATKASNPLNVSTLYLGTAVVLLTLAWNVLQIFQVIYATIDNNIK